MGIICQTRVARPRCHIERVASSSTSFGIPQLLSRGPLSPVVRKGFAERTTGDATSLAVSSGRISAAGWRDPSPLFLAGRGLSRETDRRILTMRFFCFRGELRLPNADPSIFVFLSTNLLDLNVWIDLSIPIQSSEMAPIPPRIEFCLGTTVSTK